MLGRYPKAEAFVLSLVRELCPSAEIEPFYNSSANSFDYRLEFENQPSLTLRFDGDRLDDLEEILKRNGTSLYDEVLKNSVRFVAYITLGKAGLMPRGFPLSEILTKERGDWKRGLSVTTDFDDRFTREIVEGLEKLHRFLEGHLAENEDLGDGLDELRSSHVRIADLLQYYRDTKYLNDSGISTETLGFFKAAILTQIVEKEVRRIQQPLAEIRAAIDREIYTLVEKLRNSVFLHVPLPNWFSEYRELTLINVKGAETRDTRRTADIEAIHVFLSHKHDDVKIAEDLKGCFEHFFGVNTFVAHKDIQPSAEWRRTILRHLEEVCNVFIPILTQQFRESPWTDQEAGIALARELVIAPLKVEIDPHGFLDERQAVPLSKDSYITCVRLLVGIATEHLRFQGAVRRCLVRSLWQCSSFDRAGVTAEALASVEPFTQDEVTEVVRAIIANPQVHASGTASAHLAKFLERHRSEIDSQLLQECNEKRRMAGTFSEDYLGAGT